MTHLAKVLVVSDSLARGEREDLAGPALRSRLEAAGLAVVEVRAVPDGASWVEGALRALSGGFTGLIVTTGGTGFSPRDQTPEGTLAALEREAPGLAEAMRLASPLGRLSRARAGTLGRALVLNLPGSPRGALECLEAVIEVVPHALDLLGGGDAPHPPETGGSTATSS